MSLAKAERIARTQLFQSNCEGQRMVKTGEPLDNPPNYNLIPSEPKTNGTLRDSQASVRMNIDDRQGTGDVPT
jgi:hypothetical protein